MNIETMSVNVSEKFVAINGEGHTCAPEDFPQPDTNIAFLQWHPQRQGKCKGSVGYHVGGGHGIDDFTLLEPFVKAWEEARARKEARTALTHAEAQGAFDQGVAPSAPVEDDPLPKFLQPSVAPEMQSRLTDFERRVQERLEEVSNPLIADDPRFAELRQELIDKIDDLGKALRREIAAAMRQIGGGQ